MELTNAAYLRVQRQGQLVKNRVRKLVLLPWGYCYNTLKRTKTLACVDRHQSGGSSLEFLHVRFWKDRQLKRENNYNDSACRLTRRYILTLSSFVAATVLDALGLDFIPKRHVVAIHKKAASGVA